MARGMAGRPCRVHADFPMDPEAERLIALIREGNRAAAERMLRSTPQLARTRGAGGSTPLMFAALYRDISLMKQLLAAGADPNLANAVGVTALMWSNEARPRSS